MTDGDTDRFDVSPHLVHRAHARDLFLSTVRPAGPDHFEVSARWPADHPFYGPEAGRHDPLLLLETVRQTCLAVGHGGYGIPRDSPFIVRDKEFEVDSVALRAAGEGSVDLLVDMMITDIERRGRTITGMRFDATCSCDGTRVGMGSYRVSFASAGVYRRLRGPYHEAKPALACDTPPVRPEAVGRGEDLDVLLAEVTGTRGWCLRIDPAHPVLFDHVMDHVPGNVVVEAARQAAYLVTGRPGELLVRGAVAFARYIEFDTPCTVLAEQVGDPQNGLRTVAVTFTQGGHVAADSVLELLG